MNRALIIKGEHLHKIFYTGKCWEMRSTKTDIRGKIGLIESGSGMIVGEAEIIGCSEKPINENAARFYQRFHQVSDLSVLKKWCYAWHLDNVKKYKKPIPYTHPKGAVIWVKI